MNRELYLSESYRLPVLGQALELLAPEPGTRGLDVGCGAGFVALRAALAVGPGGRVVGLDQDGALLEEARKRAARTGLEERLSFEQGQMDRLPFSEASFDWLISMDCAGYARPVRPRPLLKELARVLKPGGLMALLAWSSQMLLPGYPALEARLNATGPGLAPFSPDLPPGEHFSRALGWMAEAGLGERRVQTLAGQFQAPLDPEQKEALAALLAMRWPGAEKELGPEEAELFLRLTRPGSGEYILDQGDYQGFFTYTLFWGRKPGLTGVSAKGQQ